MSRGFRLGPWARFAGPAPRLPAASGREDAPDRGGGLRPVGGRCPACGLPYRGFSGPDTGVIRVDRARWRAACPEALRAGAIGLAAPGACRALRAAWWPETRPETWPAGSPKPGAGRS
ncbi:hypothetical protein PUR21_22800 [Methylorubrum rhodesianum]|uniref:Uncharacterized protein n=1 Tax=Methylorubrum rhodesianum TaxID=29427 RepID=A0ABU9ZG39_9HYPH|nr:hypothetical protein [Methylobacterium sp. DB1607]